MYKLIQEIQSQNIGISVVNDELELSFEGEQIDTSLIEKIKANKIELINLLKKHHNNDTIREIQPAPISDNYPISNAQRRLWFTSQIGDNSKTYNLPNSVFLQDISVEKFKKAVCQVIDRHEILRTIFKEDEKGDIRQWILTIEELAFEVEFKDYYNENSPNQLAQQYIDEDKFKIFDLENGPLIRAVLFKVSSNDYIFYYNMHHIISDEWSMDILMKDTITYYEAFVKEIPPHLPKLKIQYKDYSAWQVQQRDNELYEQHKKYWLNKFSGELITLDLIPNQERPNIKTNKGRHLKTYISSQTTENINTFVSDNGGSLFMVLLASWNVLLYKYTSQNDIIIGASLGGRDHVDLETQIGFYIKTIAIRNQVNPNESFINFYNEVRESVLSDFVNDQYPYDTLVEELELIRDVSRNPLFDIMITLQNVSKQENIDLNQKNTDDIEDLGDAMSKFDIDIEFSEVNGKIGFSITFNSDIYENSFVMNLMKHYKELIKNLIIDSQKEIGYVSCLNSQEKTQLLFDFNNVRTDFIEQETIVSLFRTQVDKTPNEIAIICEGESLTYKSIEEKSNQLANFLLKKGVSSGDIVPLYLDRSLDLIIGILGILKCGGAYVPISFDLPKERINYIINDTKGKVLLTSSLYKEEFKNELISLIYVDSKEIQSFSFNKPNIAIKRELLAYVIYTSGTTGTPKGVMISHKALSNYVQYAMTSYVSKTPFNSILFTSISFDLTVTSIYTPLCTGGIIDIIPSQENEIEVLNKVANNKFNMIKLTPSHVKVLISILKNKNKVYEGSISKIFIIGGEPLSREIVQQLYSYYGDNITIWNEYGPTESTVGCISMNLENNKLNKIVPIGKPISNVKAYILDTFLETVPVGVIGELYLGGEQLANGYLGLLELTGNKFITNPFNKEERLYKTGDLAKWLEDGTMVYKGRIDNQVKINGYRIEPDEITQYLICKEGIDNAIVVAKNTKEGNKELIAYIVSEEEQNIEELQVYLSGFLPNYMLPSYYVQLKELLLTTNGKIDEKRLPLPDYLSSSLEYIPPSTETEIKIFEIWEKYLDIEKIGINDNFFSIGGNSIKAIKIIAEVQRELKTKIDTITLFKNPTIKNLSEIVDVKLWHTNEQSEEQFKDKVII